VLKTKSGPCVGKKINFKGNANTQPPLLQLVPVTRPLIKF